MDSMPQRDFWALHAVLVFVAGVVLLAVRAVFGSLLAPTAVEPQAAAAAVPAH